MAFDLVISIINFRTTEMTLNCVRSALADTDGLNAQIVVVDNASGDGSGDAIANWIAAQPDNTPVLLIRSATNSGFSGGHNQTITAVEGHYYLLMNSDGLLRQGCCQAILDSAHANPDAGLIAPRIEDQDGVPQHSFFRFASPASELIRGAETGPITRLLHKYDVPLNDEADLAQLEWASFACIALNAKMIAEIGSLDEGYFLYFEDTEYCLRATRAGWSIQPCLDAVAIHYQGGSGPVTELQEARKRMPAYYYASRTRFFYQAYGGFGLLCANLAWYLGRVIAQLRRLAGKPVPRATQYEATDIWTNIRTPLGSRHAPGE